MHYQQGYTGYSGLKPKTGVEGFILPILTIPVK
jgi:hypothetical protein